MATFFVEFDKLAIEYCLFGSYVKCEYHSSLISQTLCFLQTARMRSYSSGGTTPPVGLFGELRITMRVFAVMAFSITLAFKLKPSSGRVSTWTGVPPAYFTISG